MGEKSGCAKIGALREECDEAMGRTEWEAAGTGDLHGKRGAAGRWQLVVGSGSWGGAWWEVPVGKSLLLTLVP